MNMWRRVVVVPHANDDAEKDGEGGHSGFSLMGQTSLALRFDLGLSVGSKLVYFWYSSNKNATRSASLL